MSNESEVNYVLGEIVSFEDFVERLEDMQMGTTLLLVTSKYQLKDKKHLNRNSNEIGYKVMPKLKNVSKVIYYSHLYASEQDVIDAINEADVIAFDSHYDHYDDTTAIMQKALDLHKKIMVAHIFNEDDEENTGITEV